MKYKVKRSTIAIAHKNAWINLETIHLLNKDDIIKEYHEKYNAKLVWLPSKGITHIVFDSKEDFVLFMLTWS